MNENLIKAQDSFLDKVNQICSKFGLNNIMAQLYAILYLSGKPLSLNDMVERLKISKGSASVNIRALERYGAVKKTWVRGSRKDYYEAEMDIYKVMLDRVKSISQARLSELNNMVTSSCEILNLVIPSDLEEKEDVKIFRQRLDKLKSLHDRAQSLFNLFNSGLLSRMLTDGTKKNSKKEEAAYIPNLDSV